MATLCDPIDGSPPGSPLSLGFSRQEHWSGLPFPSPMHRSEKWKWSRSVVPDSSDPMDCSPPGSSVHGIFQARALEWGAIAFSDGMLITCKKEGSADACCSTEEPYKLDVKTSGERCGSSCTIWECLTPLNSAHGNGYDGKWLPIFYSNNFWAHLYEMCRTGKSRDKA